jgi:uncharacterized protein YraI
MMIARSTSQIVRRILLLLSLMLIATLLVTACGDDSAEVAQPATVRTARPTFTPTPQSAPAAQAQQPTAAVIAPAAGGYQPVAEPAATPAQPVEPIPATLPPAGDPAIAVVNTDLVNARTGPGTDFTIVTILGRGEEFKISGRDVTGKWWRVCCIEGEEAWIVTDFVDTDGAVDSVMLADENTPPSGLNTQASAPAPAQAPVAQAPAAQPATAAPASTPTPATQAPPAEATTSGFEFNLVAQERFPETNVVRVFLYAYAGNDGLEGYSLRVSKDGIDLPVSGESFGGRPGLTWPIADPRQRSQNFKVEFPGQSPAGVWEVQLTRGGAAVGPSVQFNLEANDSNREMYVRYERPE